MRQRVFLFSGEKPQSRDYKFQEWNFPVINLV